MIYFPQLSSRATGQFPLQRQRITRTVVNQSWQDYQIKLADPGAAITGWHLSFNELSDQELAALEALFQTVEGSLTPFTFLDPTDNLLAWSEELEQPAWQPDPLLLLTGGLADPLGGSSGYQLVNNTPARLILQQTINGPASLEYCLSVYAKSDQSTNLYLVRGSECDARSIGMQWQRISSAGQLESSAESITVGVALDPGSAVAVFGMQVEAQSAASMYKSTSQSGGVYQNARFGSDSLIVTTSGPGRHSCELDIVNVEYL